MSGVDHRMRPAVDRMASHQEIDVNYRVSKRWLHDFELKSQFPDDNLVYHLTKHSTKKSTCKWNYK